MDEDDKDKTSLEDLLRNGDITKATYDKTLIAKNIIETKYNLKNTKALEANAVLLKIETLDIPKDQKDAIKKRMYDLIRQSKHKQTIQDYESIYIIGRGAFGEVHVCRNKKTKEIVAIKKIKKANVVEKNQTINAKNEQAFLSKVKSPWIVELKSSFQEGDYLYLVMEYLPGGDLMNLLILKDTLTEKDAQFYFAELILCIEVIHKLNCIHRDIKPDNILIDKKGHIKLSDFGLGKISDSISGLAINSIGDTLTKHRRNYSCVGTAYYVAPEVLDKKGYGKDIDWWSAGAILYEMLIGYAPFYSEHTSETCYKIQNWQQYLKFPTKKPISPQAKDLILKLLCSQEDRLGKEGVYEIKSHPFFKGIEWSCIGKRKPPFIPQLKTEYDNVYFETFEVIEAFYPTVSDTPKRKDLNFLGYTYNSKEESKVSLVEILNEIIDKANSDSKKDMKEKKKNMQTINADDDLDYIFGEKSKPNRTQVAIIPLPQKIQIDCSKRLGASSEKKVKPVNGNLSPLAIGNAKLKLGEYQQKYTTSTTTQESNGKTTLCTPTAKNTNNNLIDVAKEQLSQIHQKIKKKTHKSPVPRLGYNLNLHNKYTLSRKFTTISAGKKANQIK